MNLPPNIPHELYIDLSETEGTPFASLLLMRIEPTEVPFGPGPGEGLLLSADRGAHGAELHLTWEHVRKLRDALSRLLLEAEES